MRINLILLFILTILTLSCQTQTATSFEANKEAGTNREIPTDWQKIETDYFSFSIPRTMKKNDVRGIDSFVMQFENDEITLDLDYGMHSTVLEPSAKNFENSKESVMINGKETELISFDRNKPLPLEKRSSNSDGSTKYEKVEKNYVIGINFPYESKVISSMNYFTASFIASCKTLEAQETAKTIFYSIKFKQE